MQRSIFKRYLGITMGIILLSFVLLGSMMLLFFRSYGFCVLHSPCTEIVGSPSFSVGPVVFRVEPVFDMLRRVCLEMVGFAPGRDIIVQPGLVVLVLYEAEVPFPELFVRIFGGRQYDEVRLVGQYCAVRRCYVHAAVAVQFQCPAAPVRTCRKKQACRQDNGYAFPCHFDVIFQIV